jgi:hypothetical protein
MKRRRCQKASARCPKKKQKNKKTRRHEVALDCRHVP